MSYFIQKYATSHHIKMMGFGTFKIDTQIFLTSLSDVCLQIIYFINTWNTFNKTY